MFWRKRIQRSLNRHEDWLYNLENQSKRVNFNRIVELDKKLNLILKELGKEYVPESSKTESAKLVDKSLDWSQIITVSGGGACTTASAESTSTKPKKKRGRLKKK